MAKHFLIAAIVAFSTLCVGQNTRPLTNDDILDMVGGGLSPNTIVLAIQKKTSNFDVSPSALLRLKRAGVPDAVMQAMLSASGKREDAASLDDNARALLQKVGTSIGGIDRVTSETSAILQGTFIQQSTAGRFEGTLKRETIFPNKSATQISAFNGQVSRIVITPEDTFVTNGANLTQLPPKVAEDWRESLELDPMNILRRANDSALTLRSLGSDTVNGVTVQKLRVGVGGREAVWYVDANGHVVRIVISGLDATGKSTQMTTDYADFRPIAGIAVPFSRHSVSSNGQTSDLTINTYQINATSDPSMFARPAPSANSSSPSNSTSGGLQIRVLQTEQVPYSVQYGGNSVSTSCSIGGVVTTNGTAMTSGNVTYGSATSYPNLHMNCNTYQNPPAQWRHILNTMLVIASNNSAYIIACDAAWRWSKCRGLVAGDIFNAVITSKGLQVEYFIKGKPKQATYQILQQRILGQ